MANPFATFLFDYTLRKDDTAISEQQYSSWIVQVKSLLESILKKNLYSWLYNLLHMDKLSARISLFTQNTTGYFVHAQTVSTRPLSEMGEGGGGWG